jgi:uncharacterized protein (UPF0276 family)
MRRMSIMTTNNLQLGLGIGWRPELALEIDRTADLGFVEITAESFASSSALPEHLRVLRSRGLQVVPHGISLSLGGADPIDPQRVAHLAALAHAVETPLVSEHIAFVRAAGREAGHLLPIPRTREALAVLVENVRAVQRELPVPLALENISALFDWPQRDFEEADFLAEVVERTGAWLLLDVANVYANHRNLGTDPVRFFERLPMERIAYVHMGGGFEDPADGVYHDTHAHAMPDGAVALLEELVARASPPGVMLERDDHYPTGVELAAEIDRMRGAIARGDARRKRGEAHAV